MRNPFRRKQEPVRIFTGSCRIREYTGDGWYVGPCEHATYNGECPRHGDVSPWLNDELLTWPADYQLPKYDNSPWAERLRARQENHKRNGNL